MSPDPVTPHDLRSAEYQRDPFPVWRRLREDQPLFYDEPDDRWVLTRYDDVVTVLTDYETYSTRTYQERFRPIFGRTLAELDGAQHVRERSIVAPAFVGRSLRGYQPFLEQAVAGLAAAAPAQGEFDLVDAMTNRLPLTTIAAMLGFGDEDTPMLLDIGNTILAGLADDADLRAAGAAAHRRLADHLEPLIEARRRSGTSDLISQIVQAATDGQRLTDEEIYSFVSFLLVAGGPTTDMALRNFWWALLSDRDEFEACRTDRERIGRAFSESLRRDGPIVYEDRRTNVETEWYGQTIPIDSNVLVCLGSANTDDSVFAHADHFDADRTDLLMGVERRSGYRQGGVAGHLAFGLGSHFCMGYQLARAEVVTATDRYLLDLPDVRLVRPQELHITWYERTVASLPVMVG